MKKLSSRDLQVFVGGAFAMIGLRALIWFPLTLWNSPDLGRIIASIITALTLPIGIGILFGRKLALGLAELFLWLTIVGGCITIPLFYYFARSNSRQISKSLISEMVTSIVLLGLIIWSRSRRFQREPEA